MADAEDDKADPSVHSDFAEQPWKLTVQNIQSIIAEMSTQCSILLYFKIEHIFQFDDDVFLNEYFIYIKQKHFLLHGY